MRKTKQNEYDPTREKEFKHPVPTGKKRRLKGTASQKISITRWFHIQKPNSPKVIKIVLEHRKWGKPPNSFYEGNRILVPKSDLKIV